MIVEQALALAGPGSVLAARPRGVAHVIPAGPLTPAGAVPRRRRPVCRTRTRQLRPVTPPVGWSSLTGQGGLPRLCARCTACLHWGPPPLWGVVRRRVRQAVQHPRSHYLRTYAALTPADLLVAVHCATTPAEVDQAAHLSLVLVGHRGCTQPVTWPSGRQTESLHAAIRARRAETPHPDLYARAAMAEQHAATAQAIRTARAEEARLLREQQRPARIDPTGAPL